MPYKDINKQKKFQKIWYQKHKIAKVTQSYLWRQNNLVHAKQLAHEYYLKTKKLRKQKYLDNRKEQLILKKLQYLKRKKSEPWICSYNGAKQRCSNRKNKDYKNYGAKGIKFLLSKKEYQFLWIRDKAYLLKEPSIDRIKSNRNYSFKNCRFKIN